jgi:NitT/TauT family transport system ATP-binding protein
MADDEKKTEAPAAPSPAPAAPSPVAQPAPAGGAEATLAAAEAALAAFETEQKADAAAREVRRKEAVSRPPVVRFDRVSKIYAEGTSKEFTAIRDVTFSVEDLTGKGEFICMLGPSGCGKSTVLRMIAGLEPQHPPTIGTVEVFGKPVEEPGADRGMVFQAYTSFDHRTVLQNIVFGLECRGMGRAEREELGREWIGKVGLSVKKDAGKYPHQLSGGMQQRVAIARTLILKPRIILMDEPFGALDPVTRAQMQDMLVALWREVEATVFFVTHSIEEAVYLGDRVHLYSSSPGTMMRELVVPPPDRPSAEMQKSAAFQAVVYELRDIIGKLEAEQAKRRAAEDEDEAT